MKNLWKKFKIWRMRGRILQLQEAIDYMTVENGRNLHLIDRHQQEIRKLKGQIATLTPADVLLKEALHAPRTRI